MITNLWGKMDLYCGNVHEEKMELKDKPKGMFYECPICKNSFSLKDIEKFFDKIEDIEREADLNDEMMDITNTTIKVGHCQYRIAENDKTMKVVGVNKKAIVWTGNSRK